MRSRAGTSIVGRRRITTSSTMYFQTNGCAAPSGVARVFWLDAIDVGVAAARLPAVDRAWMAAAERAIHAGTIDEVELVIAGRALALGFRVPRPSLIRRWRSRFSSPHVAPLLARFAAEATRG